MGRGGGGKQFQREVVIFAAMFGMQFATVGIFTLFKSATMEGMSHYVFVPYSYGIASLALLLPTFISNRSGRVNAPLSFPILYRIGLLAVTGSSSRIIGYTGLYYSSPILSSAIGNLNPAFTFILALIFRMEKVIMRRRDSQAKVVGTIVSITGAFIITLYKGLPIVAIPSPSSLTEVVHSTTAQNWVLGSILLALQYILGSLWSILLTKILEEYSDGVTVIFIYNTLVSIIGAAVTLIVEGTSSAAWILTSNTAFASIISAGVMGSCLCTAAEAWVLPVKGPVYVAMFTPFSMVIAVAMGVMLLGDTLYLGSLIGATVISIGFYMLMWGKVKEENATIHPKDTSAATIPFLLQSYATEPE
ncbi:WAT1-related protein At3g28050 [Linum grandiflorum]